MSIGTLIKTIQDIMRKDVGVDGDAQRISQIVWLLFLKIFDDKEQEWQLTIPGYKSPLQSRFRWNNWAKDAEGITGEELIDFVNNELFPSLKQLATKAGVSARGRVVGGPTNGFSPKAVDYETQVRSLTLTATTSGVFRGENSKFIADDIPLGSDLWLRDGDILVQRGNTLEYVGVPAIYRGAPNCYIYPDLMMKLRISSELDTDYVYFTMSSVPSRDFLRMRASGTSGTMPKINQQALKNLPVPVPPLAEQKRIVSKIKTLMTLCDALEQQIDAATGKQTALLDAVTAQA